jgi:chromosomal replication initiation ATPase DnaA
MKQNKELFVYLNMLVQAGLFVTIEVNFFIVGHIHSSIDQYFSVLSKAIRRAGFIGSPLSLEQVLKTAFVADKKGRKSPCVVRQIGVYFDMVTALKPFINSKIKFYGIPHNF